MHKRTIALAAAALLVNGAAITQAAPKQPRTAVTNPKTAKAPVKAEKPA